MTKLNVLLYSNLFPNPQEPNRGVFTYQTAQQLKSISNITIVSPLPWSPRIPLLPLPKRWSTFAKVPYNSHIKDIDVYYPKYFMIPNFGDYFSYITAYVSLCHLLKKLNSSNKKIDVINAHWAYPDGVAAEMAARRFNIPVVISLMGSDINRDMKIPYLHKHIKRSLVNCTKIVTVSTELKDTITNYGIAHDKITVINNGVDFEKFTLLDKVQCRQSLGLECDKFTIVFIGRLEAVKGLTTLIQAVKKDPRPFQNTKIILVGDGSLSSELSSKVNKYNLQNIFHFAGVQNHDSISNWYGAADLFCLPSLNEGHPNVVMEAIASGRPVVASDVGAVSQFVTPEVGRLFQAGNHNSLWHALNSARDHNWSPRKIRGSIANMTWAHTAEKYLAVYNAATQRNK